MYLVIRTWFNKLELLVFLLLLGQNILFAQEGLNNFYLEKTTGPELSTENKQGKSAFVGGFYEARFCNLDVDLDGIEDLLVFDYKALRPIIYLGNGDSIHPGYKHAPSLEFLMPQLYNWVKAADFNNDGKKDLFTANNFGGIRVYLNTSSGSELSFKLFSEELSHFDEDLSYYTNVVVPNSDLPEIIDFDNDGDIDVLAFDGSGNVTYYQNQYQELYGNSDDFEFKVITYCWGRFGEFGGKERVALDATCRLFLNSRHDGNNISLLDYDNDGDYDAIISDADNIDLIYLENGRNPNSSLPKDRDIMTASDTTFPSNSKAVNITRFPSPNLVDVNFDGALDLVCAPSYHDNELVINSNWLYLNEGSNKFPKFVYKQDDYLQNDAIDLGKYSAPAFFDFDNDGDKDLFVAACSEYEKGKHNEAFYKITLFENIGDTKKAVFKKDNGDFLNLSSKKLLFFNISFGDADNDGTTDLLLGTRTGKIVLYSNKSVDGRAEFALKSDSFMSINVSGEATPFVYDVNNDGKNDLVIGNLEGSLEYYRWTNDSLILESDFWGGVEVGVGKIGFACPNIHDYDNNGKPDLLVSSSLGYLNYYPDFDYTKSVFEKKDDLVFNGLQKKTDNYRIGRNLKIASADLDGDSLIDVVVGNMFGGVYFYKGLWLQDHNVIKENLKAQISIFPNPANHQVFVKMDDSYFEEVTLQLMSVVGLKLFETKTSNSLFLNTSSYLPGLYFLRVNDKKGNEVVHRLVIE